MATGTNSGQTCEYLASPPSYEEFLKHYLLPNKPVIIGPSLVSSWPACKNWVAPVVSFSIERPRINWGYLAQEYGHHEVTVADCSTREFSDQKRSTMLFRSVIDLWRTAQGSSLYVKDWHLARIISSPCLSSTPEYPTSSIFYTTPDIFLDDWMNAYYSACTADDFRFVYVGAAGTFTPLHRDVYTSYSWSTNVCGRKRWWLFPPEQTKFLFRKGREEHAETAYDVRDVDTRDFPEFGKTSPIVVEQGEGETIFVPSGWYHQVENLSACISINHNWCNSVNLPSLYDSMCAKVVEVERALEDVKELLSRDQTGEGSDSHWEQEWVRIVQDVVEKDAGWNWMTFWRMVLHAMRTSFGSNNVKTSLWQPAPPDLTPSWKFIRDRVKTCYDDFLLRDRREAELVDGLKEVLDDIARTLTS